MAFSVPIRPWHVFVLLAFTVSLNFQRKAGRLFFTRLLPLDISVMLFILITLLTELVNAGDLNYSPNFVAVANPMLWLIIYWSARFVLLSKADAQALLAWFTIPVFPSVALGFAQVMGVDAVQQLIIQLSPNGEVFASRVEDGLFLRATGLVQHWMGFSAYLCTVVTAAMALLILARIHRIGKELYAWLVLSVACFGVLTTLTISGIITAFSLFIICSKTANAIGRALFLTLLTILIGIASLSFLVQDRLDEQFANRREASSTGNWMPSTLLYRYNVWITETIPAIKDRSVTGWGIGAYGAVTGNADNRRTYPYQLVWMSAESQWLNNLITFGIAGSLGFLLVLFQISRSIYKGASYKLNWISTPLAVLVLFSLLTASTTPVFTNHGMPIGLWMLLGVLAAFTYLSKQHHRSQQRRIMPFKQPSLADE